MGKIKDELYYSAFLKNDLPREEVMTACIQLPVNVDENAGFRVFHACALITEAESRRDLAKDATLGTHTDHHKIHKIN
jgi:hypothetical protein